MSQQPALSHHCIAQVEVLASQNWVFSLEISRLLSFNFHIHHCIIEYTSISSLCTEYTWITSLLKLRPHNSIPELCRQSQHFCAWISRYTFASSKTEWERALLNSCEFLPSPFFWSNADLMNFQYCRDMLLNSVKLKKVVALMCMYYKATELDIRNNGAYIYLYIYLMVGCRF